MSMLAALNVALTTRLRGDATLVALLPSGTAGIANGSMPSTTARPYLTYGNPIEQPGAESFGVHGSNATIQFDTWSPTTVKSDTQVNAVLDRVEVLLRTPIALTGHTQAIVRKGERGVLIEDDETRHGWMRFRFLAAEAA